MTISVTLADANILISRTLRDYFVYAAKLGALEIHWSVAILDETTRNLIKRFDFTTEDAEILVERLEAFLPSALVEIEKRDWARVDKVEMDDKDRHVLAAALSASADLLLTQNVRHFPRGWMAKRGIELIDAGTLLTRLAADCPDILREAHRLGVS
ncbi:PIN domain-containing protein [Rudaeicoccus suwonensis]|uniref:PIN domain-containing protein n=1 Tax=Rudaeicoccus suwonensis TaxID=657409 RepID=A0A561EC59_9MICO|nr:PIN domain-containing protein [Rudaeicoccus suwonensis]TWE13196.1 PIN domain-containing protein [Rudaeicoccus suwonensis]